MIYLSHTVYIDLSVHCPGTILNQNGPRIYPISGSLRNFDVTLLSNSSFQGPSSGPLTLLLWKIFQSDLTAIEVAKFTRQVIYGNDPREIGPFGV